MLFKLLFHLPDQSLVCHVWFKQRSRLMSNVARLLLVTNFLRWPSAGVFCMGVMSSKNAMVSKEKALPGNSQVIVVSPKHTVLGNPTVPPFPGNMETALFGMGCFWGVERKFWTLNGVYSTQKQFKLLHFVDIWIYFPNIINSRVGDMHEAVGYSGGFTPNPTYKQICTGQTGHAEVARIIYDPSKITYEALLQVFWENHDPTQGYRQGNDAGTQYRSAIYTYGSQQQKEAQTSRDLFQEAISKAGLGKITTEIAPAKKFYYAEDNHQQYLQKNPGGYCGLAGTGVSCPRGVLKK